MMEKFGSAAFSAPNLTVDSHVLRKTIIGGGIFRLLTVAGYSTTSQRPHISYQAMVSPIKYD